MQGESPSPFHGWSGWNPHGDDAIFISSEDDTVTDDNLLLPPNLRQGVDLEPAEAPEHHTPVPAPTPPNSPASTQPQSDRDSPIRARSWVFTDFHVDQPEPLYRHGTVKYLVWEQELAPGTGRPHRQGYVQFAAPKTRSAAAAAIHLWPTSHMEIAQGTAAQNRQYCLKELLSGFDVPHGEFGTIPAQGKRTDMSAIADLVKTGAKLSTIAEMYPAQYIRYHAGIGNIRQLLQPQPQLVRELLAQVLFGPPGTGKSHRAYMKYPNAFIVIQGRGPFDNYDGEDVIIFEEWSWTKWPVGEMDRYLDKWRCPLPCRYQNKFANWRKVLILTNDPPSEIYGQFPMQKAAFDRRVTYTLVQSQQDNVELI